MPPTPQFLPCDGCGQLADPQHIALRLQRLEWVTRFRPIHIQALLLSGVVPASGEEFLYSPSDQFQGEARSILDAVQVSTDGKSRESVLAEFQKRGLMLIHVLECPFSRQSGPTEAQQLIERQLPAVVRRIRRSLKPRCVLLVSPHLSFVADQLRRTNLGCPVYPTEGGVFFANTTPSNLELETFANALGGPHAQSA